MSHRLIKTKTGEIISQYTELPKKVRVDELKLSYHSPSLGILDSTYSLLEEITIDKGGDVYVDETYQTNETQYITTKNYRFFNQSEIDQHELNDKIRVYNNALQVVSDTDTSMARVAEDVLALLALNNVILLTDLPLSAQKVIVDRQEKRSLIPKVDPRPKDRV